MSLRNYIRKWLGVDDLSCRDVAHLRPGDILVIESGKVLDPERIKQMEATATKCGIKIVVVQAPLYVAGVQIATGNGDHVEVRRL